MKKFKSCVALMMAFVLMLGISYRMEGHTSAAITDMPSSAPADDNNFRIKKDTSRKLFVNKGEKVPLKVTVLGDDLEGVTYRWTKYMDLARNPMVVSSTSSDDYYYYTDMMNLNDRGSTITTDPVNSRVMYFCTATDRFGNEDSVGIELCVINDLVLTYKCTSDSDILGDEAVVMNSQTRSSLNFNYNTGYGKNYKFSATAKDEGGRVIYYTSWDGHQYSETTHIYNNAKMSTENNRFYYEIKDSYGNVYYVNVGLRFNNDLDAVVHGYNERAVKLNVKPGEKYEFKVDATGEDLSELSYTWFGSSGNIDMFITGGIGSDMCGAVENGDTLSINSVSKSATYNCYVRDKYGAERGVEIDLKIENHLKINNPEEVEAKKNTPYTLTANVSADDMSGMQYKWYASGEDQAYREVYGKEVSFGEVTKRQYAFLVVVDKYGNAASSFIEIYPEGQLPKSKAIESVDIMGDDYYVTPGSDFSVNYNIAPDEAENDIKWNYDTDILTKSSFYTNYYAGFVANKTGNTVLAAKSGSNISDKCTVHVEFSDVRYSDYLQKQVYYYTPVYWAVNKGITNGFKDVFGYYSTFGPEKECTREQLIVFLYRLMGKPSVKLAASPFPDVKQGDYYYKAVLWAAETGITKGYGDGTFGVGQPISREDTVTFLYRAAGKPGVKTKTTGFSDVENMYYKKPIIWAAENGITKGNADGTFGVGENCLREHIVTFMYRYARQIGKL